MGHIWFRIWAGHTAFELEETFSVPVPREHRLHCDVCMLIECPTHHMGRLDRFGQSTLYSFAGELSATNGSEQTQDSGHFGDSLATLLGTLQVLLAVQLTKGSAFEKEQWACWWCQWQSFGMFRV